MVVQKLSVYNQRLRKFNNVTIASNSYGYLRCEFLFNTDDWLNTEVKMANFSYKGRNYPVLIDENNQCQVPSEVIKTPSFCVSVFGGGITTNKITLQVEDSGIFDEDIETSTKYYNEIINQLTAKIDTLNETKADDIIIDEKSNTLQLMADGNPIGECCELPTSHHCGIESFVVTEDEQIIVTLTTGDVINLGTVIGASGATFIPHIDEHKILTWTNDGGLENPDPVDLNPYDNWDNLPGADGTYEDPNYIWESM